ncbi:hypothetical protein AB0L06_00710 [Spirillospora sp. NPDC052269]
MELSETFFLRLVNGLILTSSKPPGLRASINWRAPVTSFTEIPREELDGLIGARPLSWVVFNDGDHRISFSNRWIVVLEPEEGDDWKIDLPDGSSIRFP